MHVAHQVNVPEMEEYYGMLKTMKFHVCFLCSNVFLNFSKHIHHRKVQEV